MAEPGTGHNVITGGSNFVETPYQDQTWEIVGEVKDTTEFEPMVIARLPDRGNAIDPMFADYGGRTPSEVKERWHLPEELSSNPEVARKRAAERSQPIIQGVPEEEVAARVAAALEQGRAEGHAAASAEAAAAQSKMTGQLETMMNDLRAQIESDRGLLEQATVTLALEISRKIIDQAVEINPEYVVRVINDAIRLAEGSIIREVRVSPQDFEFIEVLGLAKQFDSFDGSWRFNADETIKAGCVVMTSSGEVDYQLDAAWDRIKDGVMRATR